jgi:hypothetical protein
MCQQVWFPLHTIGNAYVVYTAFSDMAKVLLDPVNSLHTSPGWEGRSHSMVIAIHIYHSVAFPLTAEDRFVSLSPKYIHICA